MISNKINKSTERGPHFSNFSSTECTPRFYLSAIRRSSRDKKSPRDRGWKDLLTSDDESNRVCPRARGSASECPRASAPKITEKTRVTIEKCENGGPESMDLLILLKFIEFN